MKCAKLSIHIKGGSTCSRTSRHWQTSAIKITEHAEARLLSLTCTAQYTVGGLRWIAETESNVSCSFGRRTGREFGIRGGLAHARGHLRLRSLSPAMPLWYCLTLTMHREVPPASDDGPTRLLIVLSWPYHVCQCRRQFGHHRSLAARSVLLPRACRGSARRTARATGRVLVVTLLNW